LLARNQPKTLPLYNCYSLQAGPALKSPKLELKAIYNQSREGRSNLRPKPIGKSQFTTKTEGLEAIYNQNQEASLQSAVPDLSSL